MAQRIQLRHDTAANWTSANPTLMLGEFGYETDTGKYKLGDGATAWATLPYTNAPTASAPQTGSAHGAVTLDGSGNFESVAPGAAGGYLRSNGTDFVRSTIQTSDVPTLNQSTTGSAGTATAPAAGSSHGAVTLDASGNFQSVAPGAAGHYLRSNGTDYVDSAVQAADVPTLNQNTTGSAGSFTGSLLGDVTGTQSATVVGAVGGSTAASVHTAELAANAATATPTASTIAKWDINKNFSATNLLDGYVTTATAAGTTTLTNASKNSQYFTGTTTQTVKLPVATTLAGGQAFTIVNLSTGVVTVQSSGAVTIQAMAANTQLTVTCSNTAGGTGVGSWTWSYTSIDSATLPIALGGTGAATQQAAINALTGTQAAGQYVRSDGTNASLSAIQAADVPTLNQNTTGSAGTATAPATGSAHGAVTLDTSGHFQSVAPGTSGNVLQSNGTDWVAGAPPAGSYTKPTVQKFTSSSGTYTTPTSPGPIYIRVRMVGGGGGGGGSGTGAGAGTAGGNTTFGTSLLTANGGGGGSFSTGVGGAGGTASLGTGPVGIALTGGAGNNDPNGASAASFTGGMGGVSAFGGAGVGGLGTAAAGVGATNTGSGGGGGGTGGTAVGLGPGGGAGGFIDAIITSPAATYAYAVGIAGPGGGLGTSGQAGAAGGSGIIVVEEFYQ